MFEGLKKKFSSFVDSLSKKEAEQVRDERLQEPKTEAPREAGAEPKKEEVQHGPEVQRPAQPERHYEVKKPAQQRQEREVHKAPEVTKVTRLKGLIFGHVKMSENDVGPFIEELRIGLLQSDVNYDVAERVTESIRSSLVGRSVDSKNIGGEIRRGIRDSIMSVLSKGSEVDLIKIINQRKEGNGLPFKILFLGPNGAGKTTTMAKIASMLLSHNISCVLSASDTFRAAAIEQTAYHAGRLGINVIRGAYGSDPASVAFDAIAHAKAHGIMAVLIDSAGRQETNRSLIEELKKIIRVTKPDLKVFVGESISGNALLEQVKALDLAVGLDGIILTKLDVDAKGGNTLSILSDTTVPILFFGTGEKYADIIKYDPGFIVDSMLPNN
jgi:fused signal recognition particle receptor